MSMWENSVDHPILCCMYYLMDTWKVTLKCQLILTNPVRNHIKSSCAFENFHSKTSV